MKKVQLISFILFVLFLFNFAFSQEVRIDVITARGKTPVFSDTVKNINIETTVATSNGFFRVDFTTPDFDGAFNIPFDYVGKVGVDARIQPTFIRKDAHYTGVITLKQKQNKLILLTQSPKDVPEMDSEIYSGIWAKEDRPQKFSGKLQYRAFTYDESRFVKRDFIVTVYIETPVVVDWVPVPRKWKPEHLPAPMPEKAKPVSDISKTDSVKMTTPDSMKTTESKAVSDSTGH